MIQPVQAKSKTSHVKTAVKTAAAAAVATGTVLYLAKKGKLNPAEGDNIVIKNVKAGLKKPADYVLNKGGNLINRLNSVIANNEKLSLAKKKIDSIGSNVSKLKNDFLASDFKAGIDKKVDTLKDFVESKFNKVKFSGK